ncbi:MAG: hypothetical protein WD273_04720 [Trueperaceae bacterium]
MFEFLRGLHNLLRWVVLLGGVAALVLALRGLLTSARWTGRERGISAAFAGSLHLQVLVGIVLYLVSPLVRGGMSDFGVAMGNDTVRFFLVEHGLIMILAAVAAQVGSSMARHANNDRASYLRATVGFAIAMALILYGIPWDRSVLPWG